MVFRGIIGHAGGVGAPCVGIGVGVGVAADVVGIAVGVGVRVGVGVGVDRRGFHFSRSPLDVELHSIVDLTLASNRILANFLLLTRVQLDGSFGRIVEALSRSFLGDTSGLRAFEDVAEGLFAFNPTFVDSVFSAVIALAIAIVQAGHDLAPDQVAVQPAFVDEAARRAALSRLGLFSVDDADGPLALVAGLRVAVVLLYRLVHRQRNNARDENAQRHESDHGC